MLRDILRMQLLFKSQKSLTESALLLIFLCQDTKQPQGQEKAMHLSRLKLNSRQFKQFEHLMALSQMKYCIQVILIILTQDIKDLKHLKLYQKRIGRLRRKNLSKSKLNFLKSLYRILSRLKRIKNQLLFRFKA